MILNNPYFHIYQDKVHLPDGRLYNYFLTNKGERAAMVLPVDERGRILVVKEFRYPVKKVIYNSIGGSVNKNEKPLAAARRELEEETGYRAGSLKLLGRIYGNPSRSGVEFFMYLATRLKPGRAKPEPMEMLEREWIPSRRFARMIRTGEIREPYLMSAYLLYLLKD